MRFNTTRFALAATLLSAVAFSTTAWAGGWFSDDSKEVTLEELLRHPDKYKGDTVVFTVYFNRIAEEFNPYYTEFHAEMYNNFTAWPIDARLYEKRDFERCYPHFYVNSLKDAWDDVKDLERFDAIECTGVVKHIFRGRPHIEIMEIDEVSYGMDEDEVKAGIRANAHYLAGHYDRAESLYVRALNAKVPGAVRADLNRRLGDARYGAKRYTSARTAYKRALQDAPNSAVLKKNIAACTQAIQRANGDTAAQIAPTKSVAHHLEPIGDGLANGVDAVIEALEDREKVAAMVTKENVELARRSVHSANIPEAVMVSNTETAEEEAEEPKEAAADAEEAMEEEAVEPVEEPKTEETAEEQPVEVPEESKTEESKTDEPKAEETAKEQPVEVIEEPKAEEPKAEEPAKEQPAEVTEEPKAEETATEQPAEVTEAPKAEEPKAEEPAKEETAKEQPAEVIEAPKAEETAKEQPVEVTEEAPAEEETVAPVEEEAPMAEEGMEEAPVEPNAGHDDPMPAAPDENDPRIMKVGDTVTVLPRLPFHGCAGVSYEAFRAVVEEIQNTEDPLEVAGFESEIEVSDGAADEVVVEVVEDPEMTEEEASEAGDVPSEEQGQPEQSDDPAAEPEQPEQPEENPGQQPGQPAPEKPDMYDVD